MADLKSWLREQGSSVREFDNSIDKSIWIPAKELVSEVFGRTNIVIKTASICGRLLVDNIKLSSMAPIIRMSL